MCVRERRFLLEIVVIAAAVASLAFSGCGGTTAGTPDEIISKAITDQGGLKSVRMELESQADLDIPGGHRSTMISYDGVFEQPDKWRLTVRSGGGKSEVVIIGNTSYVKLPGSDIWTRKTGGDYLEDGSSPGDVIGSKYLESATEARMVDQKGDTYHLKFDLDMESYARQFNVPGVDPSELKDRRVNMEVWILKDSMYIKKSTMDFSGTLGSDSGNVEMSMEIEFSEFDQPVTIEAPI